jgi:hypothetical protein
MKKELDKNNFQFLAAVYPRLQIGNKDIIIRQVAEKFNMDEISVRILLNENNYGKYRN